MRLNSACVHDGWCCRLTRQLDVAKTAERIGVTRIAELTGLDRLGVPVFAAIRPESRNICVFQGKGLTRRVARASAVMEAAESFHAERVGEGACRQLVRHGIRDDATVAIEQLPHALGQHVDHDTPTSWLQGYDVVTGRFRWVPLEVVSTDYSTTANGYRELGLQRSSNGLGAAPSFDGAVHHALAELVERDAVALWWMGLGRAAAFPPRLDPSSLPPRAQRLVASCRRAGLPCGLWDVTSDIKIPAFACVLMGEDELEPELVVHGFAAGVDAERAVIGALLEAVQTRLTFISGARDDLFAQSYEHATTGSRDLAIELMEGTAAAFAPWRWGAAAPPSPPARLLDVAVRAVVDAGISEVVVCDLAREEVGVPVVRVVVAGLEGVPYQGDYLRGRRANTVSDAVDG